MLDGFHGWRKVEETKENERYVRDVIGMQKPDKNHTQNPSRKKSRAAERERKLLITSQQHPSEANKTAEFPLRFSAYRTSELDGKAFSLNFYYTIRDRFHIWFYCDSLASVSVNWLENCLSLLCNVMPFGDRSYRGEEKALHVSQSVVYSNNCDNMAHWA